LDFIIIFILLADPFFVPHLKPFQDFHAILIAVKQSNLVVYIIKCPVCIHPPIREAGPDIALPVIFPAPPFEFLPRGSPALTQILQAIREIPEIRGQIL
jgi:hypothetical protein